MEKEITTTYIWQKYQKGIDYINKINLTNKTDKCHRMYNGDQWHGLKSGGEELPILNIIKGIVKYKVSTVAQNTMSAVYTPIGDRTEETVQACEALNTHFQIMWERAKMDEHSWSIIKDACIGADGYIYFGEADVTQAQLINNVNVLLGDEQNSNLQQQPYIMLVERLFVKDVRKEAERNGISQEEIEMIIPDENTNNQLGDKTEVDYSTEDGKCTSVLYMYKDDNGYVHFAKSTQSVIYKPDEPVVAKLSDGTASSVGLTMYPIVNFVWEDMKGSARGCGDVEHLISNQIELNKTLARRAIAIKQCAFPKIAYLESAVSNPDQIDVVGAKIGVRDGNAQNIQNLISYLNPSVVSPDARNFTDELITLTKELAGAGDAATGQIDPTQASGTAIIATRDQAALPLNEQVARYRQFVEDVAVLWYDIWKAYNPDGLKIATEDEMGNETTQVIPPEVLDNMMINVRIDVSQNNPFSKYAQEQAVMNLFMSKAISFDEMVEALDNDSVAPKGKLQDIIDKRGEKEKMKNALVQAMEQMKQQQVIIDQLQGKQGDAQKSNEVLGQALGQIKQQEEIINQLGGMPNEMQGM